MTAAAACLGELEEGKPCELVDPDLRYNTKFAFVLIEASGLRLEAVGGGSRPPRRLKL
jgi:hypothetical protein